MRARAVQVFERAEAVVQAEAHLQGLLPQLARSAGVGRLSYVSIQNQGDWLVELPADRTSVPAGWEKVCSTKKVGVVAGCTASITCLWQKLAAAPVANTIPNSSQQTGCLAPCKLYLPWLGCARAGVQVARARGPRWHASAGGGKGDGVGSTARRVGQLSARCVSLLVGFAGWPASKRFPCRLSVLFNTSVCAATQYACASVSRPIHPPDFIHPNRTTVVLPRVCSAPPCYVPPRGRGRRPPGRAVCARSRRALARLRAAHNRGRRGRAAAHDLRGAPPHPGPGPGARRCRAQRHPPVMGRPPCRHHHRRVQVAVPLIMMCCQLPAARLLCTQQRLAAFALRALRCFENSAVPTIPTQAPTWAASRCTCAWQRP